MELTIIQEKKAPLLQRTEITATVQHPGAATPSHAVLAKAVAHHFHVEEAVVQIKKIHDTYGTTATTLDVYVYATPDAYKHFGTIAKKPKKPEEANKPQQAKAKK